MLIPKTTNNRYMNRRAVNQAVSVVNTLQGRLLGNIVNLHEEGFMLIGNTNLTEEGIYQLVFNLSVPINKQRYLNIGAECLWMRETDGGDQSWSGFQIIDITEQDKDIIRLLGEQM